MVYACPHNSGRAHGGIEASRAKHLLRPAYSPDLAPNDFFLFGYIEGKLFHYDCESRKDLMNAIAEIFNGVDQEVLLSVFEAWGNRLKELIKHEGNYCTQKEENRKYFFKIGRYNGWIRTDDSPTFSLQAALMVQGLNPAGHMDGSQVKNLGALLDQTDWHGPSRCWQCYCTNRQGRERIRHF
jgi:hypothetical protein